MMRKICLPLFILFNLLVLTGCEDNIPRNRPTITLDQDSTTIVEPEPEIEETTSIVRPDGAIIIQPEHCSCLNGEPTSIGNCDQFCRERSAGDQVEKFYFDVELEAAITESNLGDVAGFCRIQEGEELSPSCSIEIKDEDGNIQSSAFEPANGQTSFEIQVTGLSSDETYRISIVENISGARSTTVQLRKITDLIDDPRGGTLALMPVNQYSCLFRSGSFDSQTGDLIIEDVNRFHFYFIPETRPEPLLESSIPSVNCHDLELFGSTPISSPLLEEKTGIFTVWNRLDPRFFDLDDDGTILVHELIEQELLLQGQTVSSTPELFFELSWPNGFDDGDTNPSDDSTSTELNVSSGKLGYYMTPFSDPDTLRAYCPTREHFYSESPLFKAMKNVLDIDTEGLYVGKQDNVCDFLLIKESLLKQIWFYIEGGEHIEPTDSTILGQKVQFYWPADPSSPFIKKSHQRTYTLKLSSEITCSSSSNVDNGGAQDSSGVRTNIPPHDKRIGCIPVLQE